MTIPEIIAIAVSSLGGGAAALALFIKFGANKMADIILAKHQNKLDKGLETHKAKVDVKKHVTQLRFDKEFEVLYKLVQDYYEFTYLTWNVCLALEHGGDERIKEEYTAFQNACDEYTKYFFRNSVVANKDIADMFEIGIKQINDFRRTAQHCIKGLERYEDDVDAFQIHVVSNIQKLKQIHDEINTGEKCGIKKMTDMVRNHLNSLEII